MTDYTSTLITHLYKRLYHLPLTAYYPELSLKLPSNYACIRNQLTHLISEPVKTENTLKKIFNQNVLGGTKFHRKRLILNEFFDKKSAIKQSMET